MSNIPIKDSTGVATRVDTFTRTEGADTVHTQATAVVDPVTGTPVAFATQSTLELLRLAAESILAAVQQLDTGAVAGSVAITGTVTTNEGGELLEAAEALRMCARQLSRTIGMCYPDAGGRLRVVLDATSTTGQVSSVGTVSNQSNIGGYPANDQTPSLMRLRSDTLRTNISVS